MSKRWILIVVIVVVGWGSLEVLLRQMKIGEYAESPQFFEMVEGKTALVAGGRAGVHFVGAPFLRSARLIVRCKDVEEKIEMRRGDVSPEICGVTLHFLDFVPGGKIALKATWGDDLPSEASMNSPAEPDPAGDP